MRGQFPVSTIGVVSRPVALFRVYIHILAYVYTVLWTDSQVTEGNGILVVVQSEVPGYENLTNVGSRGEERKGKERKGEEWGRGGRRFGSGLGPGLSYFPYLILSGFFFLPFPFPLGGSLCFFP